LVRNANIEILFVRADDVPELVADGVAELGITGLDLLAESEAPLEVIAKLGYGHCKLAAAAPTGSDIAGISDFKGLKVATAHPTVTARFFAEKGIGITTIRLRGSVEVAPKLGVADAIVDLVSTGSTMLVNGLRQVATLMQSEAALVALPGTVAGGDSRRVATMLRAVIAARRKRYVLMNAPADAVNAISDLIPGLEAPTVVPLTAKGLVSIQSVVAADDVWAILPDLERAGASGILVLPIQQLIP
jgi:ATP phosphoribosyltransferase